MKFIVFLMLACITSVATADNKIIDDIIEEYSKIKTVSCVVSRKISFDDKETRLLSRVYYERPNKLHVQQTSPIKRRIISDGTNFFYYIDGDPKGYSRPVSELSEQQTIELVKVPGSSEDILFRLKDMKPKTLTGTKEFPIQLGYTTTNNFNVIIKISDKKRIERIDFYEDTEFVKLKSSYIYSNFIEAIPGVFVPTTHTMELDINKHTRTEQAKFSHFKANVPISQSLFNAKPFFKGVEFVGSFKKIYE